METLYENKMAGVKGKSMRIFVRTRPSVSFSEKSIQIHDDKQNVSVQIPHDEAVVNSKTKEWKFTFDGILHNTSQEELYNTCISNLVEQSIIGYNGTVLAYGQIGAGKTYTMMGASSTYRLRGIIPRVISQLYKVIRDEDESIISVKVSYLEVYNETVNDLLKTLPDSFDYQQTSPLPIAMSHTVKPALDEEEALNMLFEGEMNRVIKEHPINNRSSRSHVIYTLYIENQSKTSCSSAYTMSTLHLVDLAGHDRAHKSQGAGDVSRETAYINKSLLCLEQMAVFRQQKAEYLSHRQSKLTHILNNSIGGNSNTVVILSIWGNSKYLTETVSTLKYGNQLLAVQNEPIQNVSYNTKNLLIKYQQDIKALEEELAMQNILTNRDSVNYDPLTEAQLSCLHHNIKQYLEGASSNIEISTCREMKAAFAHLKHTISTLEESHTREISELQSQIKSLEQKVSQTKVSISTAASDTSEPIKETKSKKLLKKAVPAHSAEEEEAAVEVVVGDQGSEGFGVGQAPPSHKYGSMQVKKKISFAKHLPIMIDTSSTTKKKPVDDNMEFCVDEEPATQNPSTPPSRSEAFEVFKKGRGKEMNKIFLQNKQLYQRKKKELYTISCQMNDHKYDIDKIKQELKTLGSHMTDHMTTTDGRLIINEHEYNLWTRLKERKDQYKAKAAQLQVLQSEVPYCERYIQESRKKLLSEFDTWFKMAFIGSSGGEDSKAMDDKGESTMIDDKINVATNVDRFDQLQTLYLKGDPSTTAYYRSQLRTEKRAREYSQKRIPGQVIQTVRNKPPGHLVFT